MLDSFQGPQRSILEDAVRLRWGHLEWVLIHDGWSLYKKRKRQTHREEGHVRTEVETGAVCLPAPSEAGRGKKDSTQNLARCLPTPWFLISGLPNCEMIHFYCLSTPVSSALLEQPQETRPSYHSHLSSACLPELRELLENGKCTCQMHPSMQHCCACYAVNPWTQLAGISIPIWQEKILRLRVLSETHSTTQGCTDRSWRSSGGV